jgi:hypothetical protein
MAELASGRLHLCAMIVEFKSCMPALIAGMTSGHDKMVVVAIGPTLST